MPIDPAAVAARARLEAARRMLKAALTLQAAARGDVSAGNPSPHDTPAPKGEFPRLRTGGGRANLVVSPAAVGEVLARGGTAVGYRPGGAHLLYLGNKGWRWLADTHARLRPRLRAILGGA